MSKHSILIISWVLFIFLENNRIKKSLPNMTNRPRPLPSTPAQAHSSPPVSNDIEQESDDEVMEG